MPDTHVVNTITVRPRVVLIVDDYADARELYRHYLTLQGFLVEEASDGFEAIETTVRVRPDVVLMDLSMPGMNGFEATRRIKGDAETASIPVLALTAQERPIERARALACGCDAFVLKPCLPKALATVISRVLAVSQAAPCGTSP